MPPRLRLLLPAVTAALVPLAGMAPAAAAIAAPEGLAAAAPGTEVQIVVDSDAPPATPAGRSAGRTVTAPADRTASAVATSNIIVEYTGFSTEAQQSFEAAVAVWESRIVSSVPIVVKATFEDLGPWTLGSAGPTIMPYEANNTMRPIALSNALKGYDQCPSTASSGCSGYAHDIRARFSSTFDFYFGTDGKTPVDKIDFMSLVMHEVGHGLGFVAMDDYSAGVIGSAGRHTPWDKMLETGNGTKLTSLSGSGLRTALTSGDLWVNGTNSRAANGGNRLRAYAPNPYEDGSSTSHLDQDTYSSGPESLMTPALAFGKFDVGPGPLTWALMQDMGWTIGAPVPTGGTVSGMVTVPTGASPAGARAELWTSNGTTAARTANIGANGAYSFTNVTPGSWHLRFVDGNDRFDERWYPNLTARGDAMTIAAGDAITANQALTWPSASRFVPVAPTRILNTWDGVGAPKAPLGQQKTIDLKVTGTIQVPGATVTVPTGATAVTLTVTPADVTVPSFITVWPTGQPRPFASALNPEAGVISPNMVTVKVGAGGKVSIFNNTGSLALLADITGYYVPATSGTGDAFDAITPTRINDDRPGPLRSDHPAMWRMGINDVINVKVAGITGVPANATAAVLNVTTTRATLPTYITAWPAGAQRPPTSTANPSIGRTTANLVAVKIGTDGRVSLYNLTGQIDVIVDVVGWFGPSATSLFVPRSPQRVLNTLSAPMPDNRPAGPLGQGGTLSLPVGDGNTLPADATGAVMNLTTTGNVVESYVTAWPTGVTQPPTSSLNPLANRVTANLSTTKLGTGASKGRISFFNAIGSVHLLADLTGYYRPAA